MNLDKGKVKQISMKLKGAIDARNALKIKIAEMKANGEDTKTLEGSVSAYDRDIAGYRKTLGIK